MPELFQSILSTTADTLPVGSFLACMGVSLLLGLVYCLASMVKSRESFSFRIALALLPAVVCVVIMMVNGNVGVGVAVAGAFSLVRFRSAQGSAREICLIFMAMGTGLMTGVGYLAYAALFTFLMAGAVVLSGILADKVRQKRCDRVLKITVPEDLDYPGVFDGVFREMTDRAELVGVKTANMGSLFQLEYIIRLKEPGLEKKLMDEVRCLNGNLKISCGRAAAAKGVL